MSPLIKLLERLLQNPLTIVRNINGTTIRLTFEHLRNGDFKKLLDGISYFLGRTSPSISYRPEIFIENIKPNETLVFPEAPDPVVSVIIPVHNQWKYTYSCLFSILKNTDGISYEIIIADDQSTDETIRISDRIKNIMVIRNEQNLGFLRNCNNAAPSAKGKYLLFLNNDTNVQKDWLKYLVDLAERDKSIGIVGAKLVYPDGRLQEAGGIIWDDASGWNFGWADDPEKPEYNYVKEADYVSGACIMLRRDFWEKAAGFDDYFYPAYYEDTDLAFRARQLGYKVMYQPKSVVVHFEGASHGKDLKSGIKSYQVQNQQKFVARWREVLTRDHFANGEYVFLAKDRSRNQKRILVIDHYVPMYNRDAGSFFMYSLLRALTSLGHKVVFWPENLFRHEPYTSELQQMGVEVIYGHRSFENYMNECGRFFDAVFLTRNHVAINFIDIVRQHIPKIIYHDPDLEFLREQRRMVIEGESLEELRKIKKREFYLFKNCDIIGIHSPFERNVIVSEIPGAKVSVIPLPINHIHTLKAPFSARNGLLFVGGTHPPNVDALLFFIQDVLPLICEQLPDVKLYVIGEANNSKLKSLSTRNVVFTGFVEDILPYFEQARLYIAPLRFGAGIKGKIIEAMSYGIPVVTTSIGAEGIGLTNGKDVLIADSKTDMCKAVVSLYNNEMLWREIAANAQRHVKENFSLEVFQQNVKETFEMLFTGNLI